MDLGYTIIVPCFYHSLFLAPFVAGDIKYFRIGGGIATGGGNILNIFSPYNHLLVLLGKFLTYRKDPFKMTRDITCIRMWGWAAPKGVTYLNIFYKILIILVSGQTAEIL